MARRDPNRVLLVDDDLGIRNLLKLHLESAQYQVMMAANGVEALRHLHETPIHTALVDLHLGEEDGMAVIERLHKEQPDLPVIILDAHATIETAFAAGRKGAFAYLSKPFEATELLHRVAEAVEDAHSRTKNHAGRHESKQRNERP